MTRSPMIVVASVERCSKLVVPKLGGFASVIVRLPYELLTATVYTAGVGVTPTEPPPCIHCGTANTVETTPPGAEDSSMRWYKCSHCLRTFVVRVMLPGSTDPSVS